LHEGESCPLCGSLDHPNPMQVVDLSDDIKIIESSILELQNQETIINQKNTEAQKNQLLLNHSKEQLAIFQNTLNELNEIQKLYLNSFIWSSFDVNDFESYQSEKNAQEALDSSIKESEVREKACRELLENIANNLKAINENQLVLKTELATLNGVITNQLSQLKVLKFQDYENLDLEHIQTEKTNLELNIDKVTSDYKSITNIIDEAKEKSSEFKGKLDSYKERVETATTSLEEIKVRINELLIENEYESLETVQSILEKSFDIEIEKEKVKQFTVNLQTANKLLEESKKIVEGKQFDLVIFREKEIEAIKSKEKVDTQIGIVSSLVNELEKMTKELEEKADLINQFSVLESRTTNLSMLSNLFSGNGFVNYVSRIYLQNLADVANVRFHRMTKNQLSLQINLNNEFEVIDYLNNGASRSVKTLSGGQGFQASLCLALALAESVQTLNKNDKNFFFIDEGFGTQDPESVAVVFETLQSLYKENRVVGIISHVSELQERIPRSINVIKHEEKGSEIFENWN
jgi:exonuclease SbcC